MGSSKGSSIDDLGDLRRHLGFAQGYDFHDISEFA